MNMRKSLGMLGAVAAASLMLSASSAEATTKCTVAVAKSAQKFVAAKLKALQKCEDAVLKGAAGFTSTPPARCNDADNKTSLAITKAETSFVNGVKKACCGKDKICGNIDDAPGVFQFGACPNVDGPNGPSANCGGLISDAEDAANCMACILEENVDESLHAHYDNMVVAATGDIEKCQQAIGKNGIAFLTTKSKAMLKCEDGVYKGKVSGPCPDAAKAVPAIDSAEAKKVAAITKACGGPDGVLTPRTCQNAGDRLGLPCSGLDKDCDVCGGAGVKAGDACESTGDCTVCVGGANAGAACFVASECPGGTCPVIACGAGDCRAVGGDDIAVANIGFSAGCPAMIAGGTPVDNLGLIQDLPDLIQCVDATSAERADCTDATGASLAANLPEKCIETRTACTATSGTTAVAVKFEADAGVNVAGIAVAVGYRNATLPGTGEIVVPVPGRVTTPQVGVQANGNDLEDGLLLSIAGVGALGGDTLFNLTFDNCTPAPVVATDFSCVVVDAADDNQEQITSGVRCFIQ